MLEWVGLDRTAKEFASSIQSIASLNLMLLYSEYGEDVSGFDGDHVVVAQSVVQEEMVVKSRVRTGLLQDRVAHVVVFGALDHHVAPVGFFIISRAVS